MCAGLIGFAFVAAAPSCSGGDDFKQGTDGGTGGVAGDASSSGGSGGTAGQPTTGGAGSGGASGSTGGGGSSGSDGGGLKAIGQSCSAAGECASGFCADGVCCDKACAGACEGCATTGQEGTCAAYAAGTDPETECLGKSDAGPGTCTGKCDGQGACEFPGTSTPCGATTCANGQQSGQFCDGSGACVNEQSLCTPYVCGASGTCLTTCATDPDCVSASWCNASTCETKKDLAAACSGANQCKSGFCEQTVCCNQACPSPFVCAGGTCKCNGEICKAGDQCVTWYEDKDGDTFGNKAVHKLGCSSGSYSNYVKNDQDCDDLYSTAFPGQTQFFDVPRTGGSYDYDCDGGTTKKFANITGKSCGVCKPSGPGGCIAGCSNWYPGWGCGGCPSSGPANGFMGDIACGVPALLQNCKFSQISTCTPVADTTANVKQACR